jgi:predicted small secreted protein
MRKSLTLLLIIALLFISDCETLRGLGKDVEKTGEWIQGRIY